MLQKNSKLDRLVKDKKKKEKLKRNNHQKGNQSDDSDFIERDIEYEDQFQELVDEEDIEKERKEQLKQKNLMRLMQSDMITNQKKKNIQKIGHVADDIMDDLFAEEEQENNQQLDQQENDINFAQQNGSLHINGQNQIERESVNFKNYDQLKDNNTKKRNREEFEDDFKQKNGLNANNSNKIDEEIKIQQKEPIFDESSLGFDGIESILQEDEENKRKKNQLLLQEQEKKQQENEGSLGFDEIENLIKQDQIKKQQEQLNNLQQQRLQQAVFLKKNPDLDKKLMTLPRKQNQNREDIKEEDGSINFYLIDLYEDDKNRKGKLYLTGKVLNKKTGQYESMTVQIYNNVRTIYFYAKEHENELEIKQEIKDIMERKYFKLKNDQYVIEKIKLRYAFELDIPNGKNYFYEVRYGFEYDTLPSDLTGKNFQFVLGTTYTALELFLLNKSIMGPQWLNIKDYNDNKKVESNALHEIEIYDWDDNINTIPQNLQPEAPILKCMSIALKTIRNPQKNDQIEIVQVSTLMHDSINIDKLTDMVGYHKKTFVRHPDPSQKMPYEFEKKKLSHVQQVQTEHALLQCFVDFVQQYDPDIILGHDIYGEIMDIIISRVEKTINNKGYKMARLCNLPSQSYKTAPTSTKVRQYTKGRLVVDTYLQGKELVKDTDYNLGQMSAKHLGIQRQQYDPTFKQMCIKFENLQQINTLIKYADQDAELTLRLMFKLQIIPLTKQLTNIGGNIWNRSLQNQRAERNEMLLMHQFFSKGYVLPDKYKYQRGGDDQEKEKKYKGGMVIEPKSGFYEDYVLLLDFNSLYPSIIQEYNLCFTTVIRPSLSLAHYHQGKNKYNNKNQNNNGKKNENTIEEENDNQQTQNKNQKKNKNDQEDDFDYPELPKKVEEKKQGILPKIIRYLVQRRKEVKQDMARENDATLKSSLNIKQLAFKLVANSMYGCLGFESSRFYAKPIAALITKQGREILSSSVQIVDQMNYEVIYGDTDSLMIYPKTNSLQELFKVGWEIKKNVSKQYSYLIFDIDGIYKRMLLLKKKKYSCLKMENFENIMKNPSLKPIWKKEIKGLDIVRRDWSNISRKVGNDILDIILKEDAPQNVDLLDLIYDYIKKLKEDLDNNKFGLKDFLITKQLTKDPSQYPDGKGLPHVVVAKRLIQQKKKSAQQLIGHIIYYAICEVPGQKSSSKSQAERAFDEMEILEKKLTIDMEYYKSSQILNVVERMIDVLPNMSRSHLADCLGLDPKKYQNKDLTGALGQDFEEEQDEEKNEFFQMYIQENLQIQCQFCKKIQSFMGLQKEKFTICETCQKELPYPVISNKIRKFVKDQLQLYFNQKVKCEQGACMDPQQLSQFYLRRKPCHVCKQGKLVRVIDEPKLQIIFKGLRGMLDTKKKIYEEKVKNLKIEYQMQMQRDWEFVNSILEKSKYEVIDLSQMFGILKIKMD